MSGQKKKGMRSQISLQPVRVVDSSGHEQIIQLDLGEFFPRCAASLVACWYLIRENENPFSEVRQLLPSYLPVLAAAARLPTPYQQEAASLAAQGYLLSGLLAYHWLDFREQEQAYKEAILFSDMGKDPNLQVCTRMQMASTFFGKDQERALRTLQQATRWIDRVSPLVQSRWLLEKAIAYAQCGQDQEATACVEKARVFHPLSSKNDLTFLYTEYAPQLCLWEGMVYLNQGYAARDMNYTDLAQTYYQQAWSTFAQIDVAQAEAHLVAGRIRAKVLNQQAETALALSDLAACARLLEKGVLMAKQLQSPLLLQEAKGILRDACIRWPNEQRLTTLIRLIQQAVKAIPQKN